MGIGDVTRVTAGDCTDLHYVDTGMYDSAEYGSVYIIDDERPALVDSGIGTDRERILDALEAGGIGQSDLAVVALVELTRAALPGLLTREVGGIVNVGSTAGYLPGPYSAVYGATKAFVRSFTEALTEEVRGSQVHVLLLAPGVTETEKATLTYIRQKYEFTDAAAKDFDEAFAKL